ncbi:MAG: hypothetical protein QF662_02430, partial [Phycisphaerae bacterium]|nr:hypothetical protein [Phycisphaerae bacterium]
TTIREAGRRLKRKARRYQVGQYRKPALDLLSQISRAVSVLTNPVKRRNYNRRLLSLRLGISDRIFKEHAGGVCDANTAMEWLLGAANWGVPIARLMPLLIRRLLAGMGQQTPLPRWPTHSEGRLTFPISVWLYRDAVVLGQLVDRAHLAERVDAVQGLQKVLKIPQDLARKIVTEVAESQNAYDLMRFVGQARSKPRESMERILRRLRRHGARLGPRMKTIAALRKLLDLRPAAAEEVLEHLGKRRRRKKRK